MKRFAAILFASLILLSSGFAQAALHICPDQGIVLSEQDCGMHKAAVVSDCCKERRPADHVVPKASDDCCSENYFFSVTPKFGSIDHVALDAPAFFYLAVSGPDQSLLPVAEKTTTFSLADPPPLKWLEPAQSRLCIWTI